VLKGKIIGTSNECLAKRFSRRDLAAAALDGHCLTEAARVLMEGTSRSIDVVAQQTSVADRDRMRRAFLRTYGQPRGRSGESSAVNDKAWRKGLPERDVR
jgi:hypothetical protein